MRIAGVVIALALGCAHHQTPAWRDAQLSADEVTASGVRVSWPGADGVSGYLVRVDGELAARLEPGARSYAADALEEATEHTITVHALDAAGRESTALSARATTLDATAPSFPGAAALEVRAADGADAEPADPGPGGPTVVLRWPAATDNVAVARYRVLVGEREVASVDAPATHARVASTGPEARFEVRARDAAGNESLGLVGTLTASPSARPRALRRALERERGLVDPTLVDAFTSSPSPAVPEPMEPARLDERWTEPGNGSTPRGIGAPRSPSEGGGRLGGFSSSSERLPPPRPRDAAVAPRSRGRVTLAALEPSAGTSPRDLATLERAFRARRSVLRDCYERRLEATPTLTGVVRVRFTIQPTGAVTHVAAIESVAPELAPCILRVVRDLRFRAATEADPTAYEVSLLFTSE